MNSRDRILGYLKEKGGPVSSLELSEKLGLSKNTVYYATTILVAAEKIKRYMELAGVFVLNEGKAEEEKIPAICPVCGEPVENVFYDGEGKLYADPSHGIIVSEGNQAYHMRPGQDCWGKHTGYPNFKEA